MMLLCYLIFNNLFGRPIFLQNYSRDLFLFLYFLLIIVSAMTSFKVHQDKSSFTGKSILYLNRHQTEEWKGWMQVFFTLYLLLALFSFPQKHNRVSRLIASCTSYNFVHEQIMRRQMPHVRNHMQLSSSYIFKIYIYLVHDGPVVICDLHDM
jgi:hypothetical protein